MAQRSSSKEVRVGTHRPVLEICFEDSGGQIYHAFEHGMGACSTQFFHSKQFIRRIFSLEDDPSWMKCDVCRSQTGGAEHQITQFDDQLFNHLLGFIEPSHSIALVDGPHLQRIAVLRDVMLLKFPYIVEHDAESLPSPEYTERVHLAMKHGYSVYHYKEQNPESLLFSLQPIRVLQQ